MCADKKVLECGVGADVGGLKVVHVDVEEVDEGFDLAFGGGCCFSSACSILSEICFYIYLGRWRANRFQGSSCGGADASCALYQSIPSMG